jgi:hypothetical protein
MSSAARPASLVSVAALALALVVAQPRALAFDDVFLGTWLLNVGKSKGPPGTVPDAATMVITDLGSGMYKSASDSTVAGNTIHAEVTFAVDGKDYVPVTTPALPGMPPIAQSVERVNETTHKIAVKLNGEVVATVLQEVSADGKTLTTTMTGLGPLANASNVTVFDKK